MLYCCLNKMNWFVMTLMLIVSIILMIFQKSFEDKQDTEYLSQKNLNLKGVSKFPSEDDFDFVIIATPTNYDPDTNYFDTSTVESCIKSLYLQISKATIVIRSTLPVGFVESVQKKYPNQEIMLSLNFYERVKHYMIVFIHQELL